MSDAYDLGKQGEDLAAEFLTEAGYTILARNFTFGKNEIDIIAENKDFIVFAEVKTRTGESLDTIRYIMSREKQRAIIMAADGYLQRYKIDKESRFDVISVTCKNEKFDVEHIPDAFYSSLR